MTSHGIPDTRRTKGERSMDAANAECRRLDAEIAKGPGPQAFRALSDALRLADRRAQSARRAVEREREMGR